MFRAVSRKAPLSDDGADAPRYRPFPDDAAARFVCIYGLVALALGSAIVTVSVSVASKQESSVMRFINVNQAPVAPEPELVPPAFAEIEALSEAEQTALVQMSDHKRDRMTFQLLRERYEAPPFTEKTFRDLRDRGFAEKPDGKRWHQLTMLGRFACDHAQKILQRKYRLHILYPVGNVSWQTRFACVCGWSIHVRRGNFTDANARRQFGDHLATVRGVDELADALAPKKIGSG